MMGIVIMLVAICWLLLGIAESLRRIAVALEDKKP